MVDVDGSKLTVQDCWLGLIISSQQTFNLLSSTKSNYQSPTYIIRNGRIPCDPGSAGFAIYFLSPLLSDLSGQTSNLSSHFSTSPPCPPWTFVHSFVCSLQAGFQSTLDPSTEIFISIQCASPKRGGIGRCVRCMCALCRVEERT